MKHQLKKLLRRVGYDLVRYVEMPSNPFDVLEIVVDRAIPLLRPFTFLQIGANNGIRSDPLRRLILRHKLPGLLVEPLPDVFAELKVNYEGHTNLAFDCCAVGEYDGDGTIFRVRPDAGSPEWHQGIASFNRSHLSEAKFGIAGLEKRIEAVTVPVRTLPSLLKRHAITDVTLLQIDAEGHDCCIVESAIRIGLRPSIINYEFIHAKPNQRAACKYLLETAGYRFIDVGRDTLAIHEQAHFVNL